MALLLSSAIAFFAAWMIVGLTTKSLPRGSSRGILRTGLALAAWLGMESCLRFAWQALPPTGGWPQNGKALDGLTPDQDFLIPKTVAVLLVAGAAVVVRFLEARGRAEVPTAPRPHVNPAILAAAIVVTTVAGVGFVYTARLTPNGGDDALSIWNLHARFMHHGQGEWAAPFTAARERGVLAAWHLDYPLGLPSILSAAWAESVDVEPWVGWAIAGIFLASAFSMVVGGVSVARGLNQGLVAGIALLGAVGYINIAALQYADVPLSAYIVAATVCLLLAREQGPDARRWLALCGWFAGLAAWTKNEGQLFIVCLSVVVVWSAFGDPRRRGWGIFPALSDIAALSVGAAPALACLVWFKWNLAPANDLLDGQSRAETLARLADPARYWQISTAMLSHYFKLGKVVAIAAPVYWIGGGMSGESVARRARNLIGPLLLMMLCGYFAAYLTTPRDLVWHLSSSMTRLAAQLWPSFILLVFLTSRSVDDANDESASGSAATSGLKPPASSAAPFN